jgi:hypothetical protein
MTPAERILRYEEVMEGTRVLGEFVDRNGYVIKIAAESGEEEMNESRVRETGFSLLPEGREEGRLPLSASGGLALKKMVIGFSMMAAGRAARVKARGVVGKSLTSREQPEEEFKVENFSSLVGTVGFREGFPVHIFNQIVGPLKPSRHVRLKELETILAADGRRKFMGDGLARYV